MANIIASKKVVMTHPASDLANLRQVLLQILDSLEAEREHNIQQDENLESLTQRVTSLEQQQKDSKAQQQESDVRLEFLEAQFPGLIYKVERSLELEFLPHPYSLDGDARCNYERANNFESDYNQP